MRRPDTSRRLFQARAAATGNARSPSVDRRLDGTTSVDIGAGAIELAGARAPQISDSGGTEAQLDTTSVRRHLVSQYGKRNPESTPYIL